MDAVLAGSSPLARGTRACLIQLLALSRLIPARAGNTRSGCLALVPASAHPRSRGEHAPVELERENLLGSSPLARGTHLGGTVDDTPDRLIPARAGNTATMTASRSGLSAHPRSRGEHVYPVADKVADAGSSPLARGTRVHPVPTKSPHRLIPARAGNTRARNRTDRLFSAHPRSRGEHDWHRAIAAFTFGSSPLARGTRGFSGNFFPFRRLIPARAGNTTARGGSRNTPAAHPRSRGEHLPHRMLRCWRSGSSPLARGTLRGFRLFTG